MKLLHKLTAISLTVGFASMVFASPLSISEQEINHYLHNHLAEKVPLQNNVGVPGLFELDYNLHDLITRIGRTDEKKVEIQGIVDGILTAKGKKHNAQVKLNLDTKPYYDAEKAHCFYKMFVC